jgi:hypothetical protein
MYLKLLIYSYYQIMSINYFYTFFSSIKNLVLFYSSSIFLHHVCSHLYIYYCVPNDWYGILLSPVMTLTPQCQCLRWIIYEGGNTIYNMWITLATCFVSWFFSIKS